MEAPLFLQLPRTVTLYCIGLSGGGWSEFCVIRLSLALSSLLSNIDLIYMCQCCNFIATSLEQLKNKGWIDQFCLSLLVCSLRSTYYRCRGSVLHLITLNPNWKKYTGCNRRNGPDFGRVFLRSYYTDITQNTYIQSLMVTEILAREVWNFDSYYSLIDYQIHIETGRNMWFL